MNKCYQSSVVPSNQLQLFFHRLVCQILAIAKMQNTGNDEEGFVLASLKDFVKNLGDKQSWLVCKNGQTKLSMEFSHCTPGKEKQHTFNRDNQQESL